MYVPKWVIALAIIVQLPAFLYGATALYGDIRSVIAGNTVQETLSSPSLAHQLMFGVGTGEYTWGWADEAQLNKATK